MVKGIRPTTVGRIKVLIAPKVELIVSRAMTARTRESVQAGIV
jgi:hypothetical protein